MRKIAGEFERPLVELEEQIAEIKSYPESPERLEQLEVLSNQLVEKRVEVFSGLTRWERTLLARSPDRPYTKDYIKYLFTDFVELHGDRRFADDHSIIGGFANFQGEPVCVIGHQKGRGTKERIFHNFGMPHPEGYRKAMRIMHIAEKFQRPILTFVDTPGAYCGIGAEERGQSEAIAHNLREMAKLTVPVIVTVTGEGGSGGALAIAIGNIVNILENAIYSVITPEGCAAILWRDAAHAPEAADAMKLTAQDLVQHGIVDRVIPEPPGGAHVDPEAMASILSDILWNDLITLKKMTGEELLEHRFNRFRGLGRFIDKQVV